MDRKLAIPLLLVIAVGLLCGFQRGLQVILGGGTHTVTASWGQTIVVPASDLNDSGNNLFILSNAFTTPAVAVGSINATACGMFIATPAASNWGCAIYTDSSGPSSLVTNCAAFSSSAPPLTGANSLSLSGCTLSASTNYWASQITVSTTQEQMEAYNACGAGPYALTQNTSLMFGVFKTAQLASFTSVASWPGSYGAFSASSNCHASFVTGTYTSNQAYDIVQQGYFAPGHSPSTETYNIVPTLANDSVIVGTVTRNAGGVCGGTVTLSDSSSDTFSLNGSGSGCVSSHQTVIGSTPRATAGTNTLTVAYSSTAQHSAAVFAEVLGTIASNSFDQNHYDTVFDNLPISCCGALSLGQSTELLIGVLHATDGVNCGLATGKLSDSHGWVNYGQNVNLGDPGICEPYAMFFQTSTSATSPNFQATDSNAGKTALPGVTTYK